MSQKTNGPDFRDTGDMGLGLLPSEAEISLARSLATIALVASLVAIEMLKEQLHLNRQSPTKPENDSH